ncbi:MAG: KAP family NTPase [Firmicutes bacterium]|nr:KAP family NTPase [Bacillota bacterium]
MEKEETNENKIDFLNRQQFVDDIFKIIEKLPENGRCAFALDGDWGSGKTHILEMFEKQAKDEGKFIVFHYNAWVNDFYDEPLVAILSAIISEINGLLKLGHKVKAITNKVLEEIVKNFFEVSGKISEYLSGISVAKIAKAIKSIKSNAKIDNSFDKQLVLKNSIEAIVKELKKVCSKTKLIFVVDELDRCLPDYAIKVLERLHHVFENLENSVLILSVDKKQLGKTVEGFFGENSTGRYLSKFIDFTVELDYGTLDGEKFLDNKIKRFRSLFTDCTEEAWQFTIDFIEDIFQDIEMRERIRLIDRAELIHRTFLGEEKFDVSVMCFEILWITLIQRFQFDKKYHFSSAFKTTPIAGIETENKFRSLRGVIDAMNTDLYVAIRNIRLPNTPPSEQNDFDKKLQLFFRHCKNINGFTFASPIVAYMLMLSEKKYEEIILYAGAYGKEFEHLKQFDELVKKIK